MRVLRKQIAVSIFCTLTLLTPAQSTGPTSLSKATGNTSAIRSRLLSAIPTPLYSKWRKYGEWDYKQQGFGYRDFTLFNFGATGSAAHIDKELLLALSTAFKPTLEDVNSLDDPNLLSDFKKDADPLDKLLKMSETDAKVIRIAPDFTWLVDDSKWPRDDVGFSMKRWDEYRQSFKGLSLSEGIVRTPDFAGAVFFVVRSNGLCTGGSSAGYVYSVLPLTPISDSPLKVLNKVLDEDARRNPDRHYAYVFKSLKTNWYAFYEIDW